MDEPAEQQAELTEPFSLDDLNRLVTWTLVRAARRVERMLVDVFATHGLTPVQFGVLVHLGTGDTFTQADLARAVLIRPQSMNTVIADMISRGLIARAGASGKGRRTPIRLTSAGHALLASIVPAVEAANEPRRIGLDARSAARLNDLLLQVLWADLPTEYEVDYHLQAREAPAARPMLTDSVTPVRDDH